MKAVALLIMLFGLSGCAVGDAVVGDPREVGPHTEALEARNPVMADVELASGDRVRFVRHDGGDGGLTIANDSGGYSAAHSQLFVPVDSFTLDEVLVELLGQAEAAGWDMFGNSDGRFYCGERSHETEGDSFDSLGVSLVNTHFEDRQIEAVKVQLSSGRPVCEYSEPWP